MAINMERLRAQLSSKFGDHLDEKLLSECANVCQMHNISGDDLYYKWETLRYNSGRIQFDVNELRELKTVIQTESTRANIVKKMGRGNLSGPQTRNFASPARNNVRPGVIVSGTPIKSVARRQDGFDLSRLDEKKAVPVAGPSRVMFVGPSSTEEAQKKRVYRYMYEKVSTRSETMDERIDYFGELVKDHYHIEELADPAAVTEDNVVVVGRIVSDSESASNQVKLNEASLVLESSRMMGSGARVPLRFDPEVKLRRGKRGMGGQGVFPGAIVALKGKNGGGGSFLASEVLSLPPPDPAPPSLVKPEGETQWSMCVACGPFTPDSDLQHRPLEALISKLKSTKPAVVLLTGPFIDAKHPMIKVGDVDSTPEEMFRTHFLERLRDFLDTTPGSLVLLVPSSRDILSDHAVFPQCELSRALCDDPRVRLLPNPARFTLNGIHVAATSVDVLFHLRKEELFKRTGEIEPLASTGDPEGQSPSDAMANLCRHILQQRSFYPIFPVPLDLAHEVNLDVTHSELLDLCPQDSADSDADGANGPSRAQCAPDILIVPSRLKQFHKVVDNTVAINPSGLTKSTYAVVTYAGHTSPGPAKDRLKIEIDRLDG